MNNKHIIINNNIKDIESKYYLKQKIKNTVDIICNKKIKFCNNKLINDVKNKIIIDYVKNSISGKINEQLLSSTDVTSDDSTHEIISNIINTC